MWGPRPRPSAVFLYQSINQLPSVNLSCQLISSASTINFSLSTCLYHINLPFLSINFLLSTSSSLHQLVSITFICLFYQSTSFYQRQLISINLSLSHSFAFSINQLPSINVNFSLSTCLYVSITFICLFYQSTSFYQRQLLSINLSLSH